VLPYSPGFVALASSQRMLRRYVDRNWRHP
jgi:hypothetical protein